MKGRDCQVEFKKSKTQLDTAYKKLTLNIETQTVKSKRMEKDIGCQLNKKKARIVILTSNKVYFISKSIIRDKEGNFPI